MCRSDTGHCVVYLTNRIKVILKMEEVIKNRSTKFTPDEISTLIEIVKKYVDIIESKETNSTTWREKDNCWAKITEELNSRCGVNYRKTKTVRIKYENMKKNLKKKLSKNNIEIFKTGGPARIQPFTSGEEILLSFLPLSTETKELFCASDCVGTFDEQKSCKISSMGTIVEDDINESSDIDKSEWEIKHETLDLDNDEVNDETENIVNFIDVKNYAKCINKRRLFSEEIPNAYLKKVKTYNINDNIAEDILDSKDLENCASRIISNSTENVLKSVANNDIVTSVNAKEELVQLQKTALEIDIRIKEENNNTQKEILRTELEIRKGKLKLINLDIQLKELEVEIKKLQLKAIRAEIFDRRC
ncbi:myb/SANT-like DNA-binding domain-containing protein 4 isoform X1 [Linepithema humile]|uniref:myb/SANT-like DNA-binding domain-containing protein 4 isoform X1 n=1 Tax=Linepithema humile TaxID=83485 RepID=UPI00351DE4B7